MSWWFVFGRRLWIIRNDDNAAVTPSVVELMAFSSAPGTFPVFRLIRYTCVQVTVVECQGAV